MRIFLFLFVVLSFSIQGQIHTLTPVPQNLEIGVGEFKLTKEFTVSSQFLNNSRVEPYLRRALFRLDGRTGVMFSKDIGSESDAHLQVKYEEVSPLELGMDEGYSLTVTSENILIKSNTDIGAIRGIETLLQLVSPSEEGYHFPAVSIQDTPRFQWRGLLIDVCRHFFSVGTLKRNIDAMAAMKMNVLHLHLTEDQGFRIESKVYPKLHEMGSNGDFFTQEQMKDLIAYANERGVRIIPEFDMPGHVTSWFVGHPELASQPRPYMIEKRFGVMDPSLDPTKENTYEFLDAFLGEMAALFPDHYFHIGGDENNGKHWNENEKIQTFMKNKGLKDNHELQNYFNERVSKILTKNKKIMVGWDEILQPDLPKNIVIQSWRGKEALYEAAKNGYKVMLSNGYYIDLCQSAETHYLNDPIPEDAPIDENQKKNVLGGEATMWAELITEESIDSRIWPRTCAIAERFWSDNSVNNVDDMYRRLELMSIRIEELGLTHIKNQDMMMRRITNGQTIDPLKILINASEPLKIYNRHHQGVNYTTDLPMTRLADIAIPDPKSVRDFKTIVKEYIESPDDHNKKVLSQILVSWSNNHQDFLELSKNSPILTDAIPLSEKLSMSAGACLKLVHSDGEVSAEFRNYAEELFKDAKGPVMETELMVIEPMEWLFNGIPE